MISFKSKFADFINIFVIRFFMSSAWWKHIKLHYIISYPVIRLIECYEND